MGPSNSSPARSRAREARLQAADDPVLCRNLDIRERKFPTLLWNLCPRIRKEARTAVCPSPRMMPTHGPVHPPSASEEDRLG